MTVRTLPYPEWWARPGDLVKRDRPDFDASFGGLSADDRLDRGLVLAVVPPGSTPGQEYLKVHMWYVMWYARDGRSLSYSFEPDHRVKRVLTDWSEDARKRSRIAAAHP